MAFGNTPKDVTLIPLGSVAVPNHSGGDLTALEGGPASTDANGNETAPASMYIKDGANIAQGLTTDATVIGDNPGTVSAKLRGLSKIFNDVWDSVNHRLHVIIDNATSLGQAVMASSSPVAIASDQTPIAVKPGSLEQTALSAGSLNADLVPATDVSAYKWYSLQILSVATGGVISPQICNDNSTFVSSAANWAAGSFAGNASTMSSTGVWFGMVNAKYMRFRQTSWTSGTTTAIIEFYTTPPASLLTVASQGGTWTVQPGNTQNTTPWLVSAGPPADLTLLASAAQTVTQTLADQGNFAGKGIRVVLDMTTAGTGSVTLEIDAKDVASGKYIALLTGAAVTTISTNVYVIHPELTAAANSIAKDILPHTWRVKITANNANSCTYSVGASYLN